MSQPNVKIYTQDGSETVGAAEADKCLRDPTYSWRVDLRDNRFWTGSAHDASGHLTSKQAEGLRRLVEQCGIGLRPKQAITTSASAKSALHQLGTLRRKLGGDESGLVRKDYKYQLEPRTRFFLVMGSEEGDVSPIAVSTSALADVVELERERLDVFPEGTVDLVLKVVRVVRRSTITNLIIDTTIGIDCGASQPIAVTVVGETVTRSPMGHPMVEKYPWLVGPVVAGVVLQEGVELHAERVPAAKVAALESGLREYIEAVATESTSENSL